MSKPDLEPVPINPAGPLCRFLRSPRLLSQLYRRMTVERQIRLFELLKYGRYDQVPVEGFVNRWIQFLDTAGGRRTAEHRSLGLARLLIEYVEQSDSNQRVLHGKLRGLIVAREIQRSRFGNREYIRPIDGSKRSFEADKLRAEDAARIFANADPYRLHLTIAYILGWALAQPGTARQICAPFISVSAEFAAAVSPGTDQALFESELSAIHPIEVRIGAARLARTSGDEARSSGALEQVRPLPSEVSTAQAPSTLPNNEAPPSWPAPLPELHLLLQEKLRALKAAINAEHFSHVEELLRQRKAALFALRQALQPYYDSAATNGIRTTELNDDVPASDIEQHITRLLAELRSAHQRTLERQSGRIRVRLQNAELPHLWPANPPGTADELQALEQSLQAQLVVREAAMALLGMRSPSAMDISALAPEQQLQATQWAVERATTRQLANVHAGRLDIGPLIRFLYQESFCREHPALARQLFLALCTAQVPVGLMEPLCRLAIAISNAEPKAGSVWMLLLVEGKLSEALARSSTEILDLLLDQGAAYPDTIAAWVEFRNRGVDLRPLLLSLAKRLQSRTRHADAVVLLSAWLHHATSLGEGQDYAHGDVMVLCRLRDCLIEDGRSSEAILLVARAHAAGCHDVLQNFEEPLTWYMLSTTGRQDQEAHRVLEALLDEPSWLIHSVYGVIAFLYVCHMANKTDWVLSARYRFKDAFERATNFHPILVGEYFLEYRFPTTENEQTERLGYASRMLEKLREFDCGLQKRSCYRSWFKAEKYQELFVKRLTHLKTLLEPGRSPDLLLEKLDDTSSERWVDEANRTIGDEVHQPALALMLEYLDEQLQRLRLLAEARKRLGVEHPIEELLEHNAISLSARLRQEQRAMGSTHPLIAQVYQRIEGGAA